MGHRLLVCNTQNAAVAAGNEALAAATFRVMEGGALGVPFGDFPQTVLLRGAALREVVKAGVRVGPDGRVQVVQRLDAIAGNAMAAELSSLLGKAKRFFMGAPIYAGHPFHPDPEQRKHYQDKRAYGWVKGIRVEEDGLVLEGVYNSLGAEAVNDAQLVYHSPEWWMDFAGVENGVAIYRPTRLRSTGLTNEPNIPVPALVSANARGAAEQEEGATAPEPDADFLVAANALLAQAMQADCGPIAKRLQGILGMAEEKDDEMRAAMAQLRADLPALAAEVAANDETVRAWEAVLGAALGEGAVETVPTEDPSEQETEEETNMLKKLLDLLASLGIIQAEDSEDVVLVKLNGLKEEMNWKREEINRQKAIAETLRKSLPAANVADLPEEGLPLADELLTVAANEISGLRVQRDDLRAALVDARLESLLAANTITGADVEVIRAQLLACNDRASMETVISALPASTAAGGAQRASADLGGAREQVIASNDVSVMARERGALVEKHIARIAGAGRKPSQAQYDAAYAAARRERPDLF